MRREPGLSGPASGRVEVHGYLVSQVVAEHDHGNGNQDMYDHLLDWVVPIAAADKVADEDGQQ